jgi:hypothetical protein
MLEHVGIENDPRVNLETFPNHPSKGNAGETVTCTVLHGPTANVAVSASEEYLFNIAIRPGHGIDVIFVLVRCSRPFSSFHPVTTIPTGGVVGFGSLGVCGVMLGLSAGAKEWDEFDTVLVER